MGERSEIRLTANARGLAALFLRKHAPDVGRDAVDELEKLFQETWDQGAEAGRQWERKHGS